MRDWKRYEEAKRLRDSGLTLKATGAALGVSAGRAREMLDALSRHHAQLSKEADNPALVTWGQDLNPGTRAKLERMASELQSHGWKVQPPGAWAFKWLNREDA